MSHKGSGSVREGLSTAETIWPGMLNASQIERLTTLLKQYGFSPAAGDLTLIDQTWYVTHSGLLRLAKKNRCSGIHTEPVAEYCDPKSARWVVKATVFKTPRSKGFVGYGDADPTNVSALVRGAELRIAETRAVNRALRKAYGIGLCSVEELGSSKLQPLAQKMEANGDNGDGQLRLRDRLLLLIRQYQLEAEQVKRYAVQFCGTASLREASREQIASLVEHLAALASEGRDRLVSELAGGREPQRADNRERGCDELNTHERLNNKEAA